MSEDTKQFLIKLLGGGLIVGSIVVGVIRLSSPSNTPVTDDIEACVELVLDDDNYSEEERVEYRSNVVASCRVAVQRAGRGR
jgi:hypothetical protein